MQAMRSYAGLVTHKRNESGRSLGVTILTRLTACLFRTSAAAAEVRGPPRKLVRDSLSLFFSL
jgi:hypothetical protein